VAGEVPRRRTDCYDGDDDDDDDDDGGDGDGDGDGDERAWRVATPDSDELRPKLRLWPQMPPTKSARTSQPRSPKPSAFRLDLGPATGLTRPDLHVRKD
jgi:hypothetical protein